MFLKLGCLLLSMKQEKSCGAVIFRKEDSICKFLLVQHRKIAGAHWDFPKGHVEKDETEEQTAVREIYEEVGLRVKIVEGFRDSISYSPKEGMIKTVVFFLAEPTTDKIEYIFKEIENHAWLDFEQALKQLTFDSARSVLKKANEFLTKSQKFPTAEARVKY